MSIVMDTGSEWVKNESSHTHANVSC